MSRMDRDRVRQLVDGELPWDDLRNEVLPDPKDEGRFENVRDVLEERVDWDDPILVPLNDHLFVVGTDDGRIVRGACGHEFCDADENWKTACRVRVREDEDEMRDLYPEDMGANPEWTFQIREFLCPECLALVEVDAVPVGYPAYKPFDPDVDVFYEEWLDSTAPDRR